MTKAFADQAEKGVMTMADEKKTSLKAADKEAKAKDAALKAAVTQIEQQFGQGSLMRLGDMSRTLYLFDTFDGMSPPTAEDVDHEGVPATALLDRDASRPLAGA